jgi:hypothetical protein
MAFPSLSLRILLVFSSLSLFTCSLPASAQSAPRTSSELPRSSTAVSNNSQAESSSLQGVGFYGPGSDMVMNSANTGLLLPESPDPAAFGGGEERFDAAPAGVKHQAPFSRIGIGADVSPLGIGIKSAVVLNEYFDARLMGNFFNYNSSRLEVDVFNVNASLHLASAAAALDWYPFNSIWRLSPGVLFYNGNQISVAANIVSGKSFTLNGQNFYSATASPVTGATPLIVTGVLGLNTIKPAATISFGFGRFIPRSDRHWSFPSEFGVAFTGAPSINVNASGWVCQDSAQTQCGNLSDPTNTYATQFNDALQTQLVKWRKDLSVVRIYPIFSYGVVYSFNIR